MIHILLMILKIIGIILLVILGLLLAAVLAILFVPVRYRADLSYDGKPDGEASLTWLLHAVRLKVSFHEHADASGYVLWFRLFDMRLWPEEEEETAERTLQENSDVQKDKPPFEDTQSTEGNRAETGFESELEEELTVHATEISSRDEYSQEKNFSATSGNDRLPEDNHLPVPDISEISSDQKADERRPGIISRLKGKLIRLAEKLRSVISRIMKLPKKIQKWFHGLSKKKHSLEKTWNTISMFWHDERNQKAFHLIWKRTKKLIRYILPKKLSGRIHFGFDDPYDTGQVLAAVSPFYGLYARTLTLEPDFTGTVLDGELHLKGRIAVWYPLWTAARLFLDKDFRRLLKFFRKRTKREESV